MARMSPLRSLMAITVGWSSWTPCPGRRRACWPCPGRWRGRGPRPATWGWSGGGSGRGGTARRPACPSGTPWPGGGPRPRRRRPGRGRRPPPVDVAAADLDPADQDPGRDLPAGLGERLGAGAGRRPAGLAQPVVGEHPGMHLVGELARGRGRHAGPPQPLGGGLGDPLRDLEAAPAGRPGRLPGPDPVVGGHVVDAPEPARGGQDEGGDGVGRGQALERRVQPADPDHGRRHQAPGQEGPPGRRPHAGPAQHHQGWAVVRERLQRDPFTLGEDAGGRELGVGAGRVGLGDRDRVVGVGPVDDPAGPQHHRGRPGGGLQRAPGPVHHPGPAALLVAVGGVDQREQDHRVHPGQGPGEGGVAGPGRDELELGAQQRRLVARQPQHPPDPGSSSSASASSLAAGCSAPTNATVRATVPPLLAV